MPPANLSITLKAFDKSVNIGTAGVVSISTDIIPNHVSDATAEVQVSLDAFKSLFAFHTDYNDVNDVIANDKFHYVHYESIPTSIGAGSNFDISPAWVTSSPIASLNSFGASFLQSQKRVKHDYVRRLSQLLFNTEYGVDLLTNEEAVYASVGEALNKALLQCFTDLVNVSTHGSLASKPLLKGEEDHRYLLNDYGGNGSTHENICYDLLNMVLKSCPERFVNLPSMEITDSALLEQLNGNTHKLYRIPFIDGDSVMIRVALKPAKDIVDSNNVVVTPGQNWFGEPQISINNVLVNKVDVERSYTIKLVLKANPNNSDAAIDV